MKPSDSGNVDGPKTGKKGKGPKKKNKKDPNEPQKPISAYALFFRDTQAAIKRQNPNASFGEVSKIVASMWDSLDIESKNGYKEKADLAKKEYLKALAAYRAGLALKAADQTDLNNSESASGAVDSPSEAMVTSPVRSPPHVIISPIHVKVKSPPEVITIDSTETHNSSSEDVEMVNEEKESPQHMTNNVDSPAPPQDASGQNGPNISNGKIHVPSEQICLRSGCSNPAIDSPEWDREYCSSDCVVEHCSAVFMAHIATRQRNAIAISVGKD